MSGRVLLFIFTLGNIAYAQLPPPGLFDVTIEKIKDGIYLASRPEPLRPFVEGNVTIIINDRDVVIVDAGGSPAIARNVIAEIRKLTPLPVRYVINTHIHRDHRFGLQEYVKAWPGVEIVAHPAVRQTVLHGDPNYMAEVMKRFDALPEEGRKEIARLKKERKPGNDTIIAHLERYYFRDLDAIRRAYSEVVNTAPTMVFDQTMILDRGKRSIELRFLGRGDTDDNIVVYLPQDGVICAGDLVVHPIPYGFSTHPLEFLDTLGRIAELQFDTLIPGHGAPQKGSSYLRQVMRLLQSVQSQVRDLIAAGKDLEALRKLVDLSELQRQFAGDDPVLNYYFEVYFSKPYVERTFKALSKPR